MYEAQVTKMQRSLERGDDEKAKVEEQLAKAMALTAQGDKQVTIMHCPAPHTPCTPVHPATIRQAGMTWPSCHPVYVNKAQRYRG